jgi:hypothetical protein
MNRFRAIALLLADCFALPGAAAAIGSAQFRREQDRHRGVARYRLTHV